MKTVFLSHSCDDHALTAEVSRLFSERGVATLVDPFLPGDRTAEKAQTAIKLATHFVLLGTEGAMISQWVYIETMFAKCCQEGSAIRVIPLYIGTVTPFPFLKSLIHLSSAFAPDDKLLSRLWEAVSTTHPLRRLSTDAGQSEQLKEEGRALERTHAETQREAYLHEAVAAYDRAVELNLANHNAWANRAWTLWKLGEKDTAWAGIDFAMKLHPDGKHVNDVYQRMKDGRYTIR
jgi:hypothetical protein